MAAQRELEDREAPALVAAFVSRVVWVHAALRAEAALTERNAYEQSGYDSQRQALQDDLDAKNRTYARLKAEMERVFELAKSGKRITNEERAVLGIQYNMLTLAMEQSESKMIVFERHDAPLRRQQLADQLKRVSDELSKAVSSYQGLRARLQRKINILEQLLSSGSAWMGRLLDNLKTHASTAVRPGGLVKGQPDGRAGRTPQQLIAVEARHSIVKADVSQIVLDSARWFATASSLAKSLLVQGQR
jgi:hypothetical protein